MIMGHTNYERSDFRPNSAMTNGCQSAIMDPIRLRFCTLIHSMIVYKFPIHYLSKLWSWVKKSMKVLIFGQFSKQNGRQSVILDPICLKFYTLIHSMIAYKFPIHCAYKLWSWVTKIMKVLIFGQIQQKKWPPVSHFWSDPSQILHTGRFDACLQVSCSLCI